MKFEVDETMGGVFVEKYDSCMFLSWRDVRRLEIARLRETSKR